MGGNGSSHRRCSVKKVVLRNFAKLTENTCARDSLAQAQSLAQVFYCELF